MNPAELAAMDQRIAERRDKLTTCPQVPVRPPAWASSVVDLGNELVAVHRDTAEPYPLDLHHDLDPEDRAVVLVRRILAAGGSADEVVRLLGAFELPPHARDRLVRQLKEAAA